MSNRDEFAQPVKRVLADRVAHRCSNPDCRAHTSGPQVDSAKAVNVGVASHITAASPGGPRYDAALSPKQRADPTNGIWLCQNCAKLVDNDPAAYPADLLRTWKRMAELEATAAAGKAVASVIPISSSITSEEAELLIACAQGGQLWTPRTNQVGRWVRAGHRDFVDDEDPAVAVVYLDALEQLLANGLCRYDAGVRYVLTGTGFKVARKLRQLMGDSDA